MRSKDRLEELRQLACVAGVYRETVVELPEQRLQPPAGVAELLHELEALSGTTQVPKRPGLTPDTSGLNEVEAINKWIDEVDADTQLIRRLHSDPTYHTNKHVQEQLDAAVTRAHAAGLKLCGALRQLEARARGDAGGGGGGVCGAGGRIARLQYAVARRRYADALAEHARLLQLLRDDRARLLHEQIKLTNLTITEEECEQLLDSNNVSLFVDNVRAEGAAARGALREAEARRGELARAEGALRDLHALFQQLSHLVAQQQDQIDSVEQFALQATEQVGGGGRELLRGTVSRKRARKKKFGLIICLSSGFLIVLLVLIFT